MTGSGRHEEDRSHAPPWKAKQGEARAMAAMAMANFHFIIKRLN
jgi:hypothetical protein